MRTCSDSWLQAAMGSLLGGPRPPVELLSSCLRDLLLSSAEGQPALGRGGSTEDPVPGAPCPVFAVLTWLIILSLTLSFEVKSCETVDAHQGLVPRSGFWQVQWACGPWQHRPLPSPEGSTSASVMAGRGRGKQLLRPGSRSLAPEAAVPLGSPVCGVEVVGLREARTSAGLRCSQPGPGTSAQCS